MIIKFCYENEIHRCSDPPREFAPLQSFLTGMFRVTIPSQIDLYYINSEGETVFLNNEEDYQKLLNNSSSKTVKIVIAEKKQPVSEDERDPLNAETEAEIAEYEVIPRYIEEKPEENIKEINYDDIMEILEESRRIQDPVTEDQEKILADSQDEKKDPFEDTMDQLTQKIADTYIMPQVQSAPAMNASEIKKLVKDALREEMPFIISQVKEALIRENQPQVPVQPSIPEQVQPRSNLPLSYQAYYSYPYYNHPINRVNNYPGQMYPMAPPIQRLPDNNIERLQKVFPEPQMNHGFRPAPAPAQMNPQQEKESHIFDKMVTALSRPINKATELVDNFVQKLEGDPYVHCAEGKYNKSVVDKVAHLKEIFPEEDKKELLDFVQRFPREAPLDHLVEVYWSKKRRA